MPDFALDMPIGRPQTFRERVWSSVFIVSLFFFASSHESSAICFFHEVKNRESHVSKSLLISLEGVRSRRQAKAFDALTLFFFRLLGSFFREVTECAKASI